MKTLATTLAVLSALALSACGGGSSSTSSTPAVDATVTALSGLLPADTEINATSPVPDSLQSPDNLGATTATPSGDELPPG